jgi:HEAT repeat protein
MFKAMFGNLFCISNILTWAQVWKALDSLLPVAMNDTDDDVRQKATEALSELNFSTAPMLAGLAETLQGDPAAIKRMRAAQTFSSFINISDQMAAETLQLQGPALAAAAMRDKVPGVRQAAAVALGTSLTQAGPYIG